MTKLYHDFEFSDEVADNLRSNRPVVALESTVLTHGLPYPQNLNTAIKMEERIRTGGACPATTAILKGKVHVGLSNAQLEEITDKKGIRKVSLRDIPATLVKKEYGGTTVAGTLFIANKSGIKVFATGGIGGIHRDSNSDISADLHALGKFPLIVVCSGAKAILDLPATIEMLETLSIPVIGFKTNEFPAFYSDTSGLSVSSRMDSPEEVVEYAIHHGQLGLTSSILVTVPPPSDSSIPSKIIEEAVVQATKETKDLGIHGQEVTPYILSRISTLTNGASLQSNIDLLLNNAEIATQIACAYSIH
ncbi:pseudouridine-5'-phosphate glycosidase [Chloroflexota bacterium]